MDWLLATLLFLHVGGAVLAFGPNYAFLFLGPMAAREPQHANFALRFQRVVATGLVLPLAVFQGITGLLIIWHARIDLLAAGWLLAGIALYLVVLAVGFGVLLPTINRLVAATSAPPPAPAPAGSAPAGPPPHVRALVRRGRMSGTLNAALVLVILFLMVVKPF